MSLEFEATDFTSAVWRKVESRLAAKLDALRVHNDTTTHDATQTALIRGRIITVKEILGWAAEAAPLEGALTEHIGPGHYDGESQSVY